MKTRKILIIGNLGYVGPVLTRHLSLNLPHDEIIGFDRAFFAHCITNMKSLPESLCTAQYYGDVRDFRPHIMDGVDSVVYLAAISNDPMGSRFELATKSINQDSCVKIAKLAQNFGVKNFVFASSCSVYGYAEGYARREGDPTNPLTAYAKSKVGAENALRDEEFGEMMVTCLRFATACGMSERLRLDLVLNDFVACALATGEINILSDGTPWRPLIDVEDMSRAIAWACGRNKENGGKYLCVNVGRNDWNYQVEELAKAVALVVVGTKIRVNSKAQSDRRSYKVDFSLFEHLAPSHIPKLDLDQSISRLVAGLLEMNFSDGSFRDSDYIRLRVLERHIQENRLDSDLRWVR